MTDVSPPRLRALAAACALMEFNLPQLRAYSGVELDELRSYLTAEDVAPLVQPTGDSWRVTNLNGLHEIVSQLSAGRPVPAEALEAVFARSTMLYDAGFRDPKFLDELANDWLAVDEQSAIDAGLTDLATRIGAKRAEILQQLHALPAT